MLIVLVFLVVAGGIKRIAVMMAVVILAMNWESLPGMFSLIFTSAFGTNQVFGGLMGSADVSHPARQGLVQAFSVYIDTLLVCAATTLMILSTRNYNVIKNQNTGELIVANAPQLDNNYVLFTQASIDSAFLSEEVENAEKNVSRALFIGLGVVSRCCMPQ